MVSAPSSGERREFLKLRGRRRVQAFGNSQGFRVLQEPGLHLRGDAREGTAGRIAQTLSALEALLKSTFPAFFPTHPPTPNPPSACPSPGGGGHLLAHPPLCLPAPLFTYLAWNPGMECLSASVSTHPGCMEKKPTGGEEGEEAEGEEKSRAHSSVKATYRRRGGGEERVKGVRREAGGWKGRGMRMTRGFEGDGPSGAPLLLPGRAFLEEGGAILRVAC